VFIGFDEILVGTLTDQGVTKQQNLVYTYKYYRSQIGAECFTRLVEYTCNKFNAEFQLVVIEERY
jgi:hypothetical protein